MYDSRLTVALLALLLASCGDEPAPTIATPTVPAWAKVAPEQIAEAEKHGVPVAFENDLGMRFVLIPAGTFLMGSPEEEEGRDEDETQHEVTISKPFYMSIHEVTNEQYRRYAPDYHSPPFNCEMPSEEGKQYVLDGGKQPVVMVSWNEATAFAKWLNGPDRGRTYRLPTEAERERACRAGTTTRFSFGDRDEDLMRYANFEDVHDPIGLGREDLDDGHGVAAPVGSFRPNPWGLHDTHGNVNEWCLDVYGQYPSGRVTDPQGAEGDGSRVVRGGSWNDTPMLLRSAYRGHADATGRGILVGFRLVSDLPEPVVQYVLVADQGGIPAQIWLYTDGSAKRLGRQIGVPSGWTTHLAGSWSYRDWELRIRYDEDAMEWWRASEEDLHPPKRRAVDYLQILEGSFGGGFRNVKPPFDGDSLTWSPHPYVRTPSSK